jgi:protein-tyrosine phosphatase
MRAEIYWVEGPWLGRLAIMPRPRGGDWLEDEVREWRSAGIDIVVSTLTSDEIAELNLAKEAALCRANGMEYSAFPITDRGVPGSAQATAELLRPLEEKLTEGKNVAIHCRQGIGRSALLAACLLVLGGADPEAALQRVRAARGCPVPETDEQREWVAKFSRDSLAAFRENE